MREFFKNNKWKLLISSLIVLAPIVVGLILWDKLPEAMNIHWGMDGAPDGMGSRTFVVFGLPLILLLFHWLCVLVTSLDKRNKGQNKKMLSICLFIMPFISLFVNFLVYAIAFGLKLDMLAVVLVILGLMFAVLGNYMPKCKRNSTMGVKLPWTLANDENWNKTHRLTGRVWVIGGVICILCVLIPGNAGIAVFMGLLLVMMLIPTVYSYALYRNQLKNGTFEKSELADVVKKNRPAAIIAAVITAAVLVFVGIICFTGDIEVELGESSFTVKASYYDDITVEYAIVDSVELCENDDAGVRTFGFGSPRLSMGRFKSDTFGEHTRYSYTGGDTSIVIVSDGKTLVIGCKNDEITREVYGELLVKISK